MDGHRAQFAVGLMCRVLRVSRSGYYAWKSRRPSERRRSDQVLLRTIREIHAGSKTRYGSPQIHHELGGVAFAAAASASLGSCGSPA